MPAVSITLVLYESADVVAACLASIREDVDAGFAEVIAVDNASPDDSADIVARELPSARIVRSESNRGFAAGTNLAWRLVDSPYWLWLNPDVVFPPRGLRRLVEWMDEHPDVGAASPEIDHGSGFHASPGYALPSIGRALLEMLRLHRLLPRSVRARVLKGPYWTEGDQLDAGWVAGTALICRHAAVTDAGLLSEDFFMYGEEIEWCWRIGKAGWRLGVCSDVVVAHGDGTSARQLWSPSERALRGAVGWKLACRRIHGRVYAQLYAVVMAVALGLEGVHPARASEQRRLARRAAWAWIRALRTSPA
jgi:N-acetylglucosaminyl-diphospho-decaprenol L-rhamnosyltransferase